jgi:hypothetical protein
MVAACPLRRRKKVLELSTKSVSLIPGTGRERQLATTGIRMRRWQQESYGGLLESSVSLTDETKEMCTEIIPGFHTREKISQWYKRVKSRIDKKVLVVYVSRVQDR